MAETPPKTLTVNNSQIINAVRDEIEHMEEVASYAEATEVLILDGIKYREMKRLGLLNQPKQQSTAA